MKKILLLTYMAIAVPVAVPVAFPTVPLHAQQQQQATQQKIDVTIVDENGEPLPGATVKASDKPLGVVSDVNGRASLWAATGSTLTISYVGMQTRTLKVSRPLTGKIVLENEATTIDQVVVNGYQRTTKRRVTGSVATLTADDLKDRPLANVDMLLQRMKSIQWGGSIIS